MQGRIPRNRHRIEKHCILVARQHRHDSNPQPELSPNGSRGGIFAENQGTSWATLENERAQSPLKFCLSIFGILRPLCELPLT